MDKREIREYNGAEFRADEGGPITGYAAVFDQPATIWDFEEVVKKGAFAKSIKDKSDVFAFWNHESGSILGRTKNDTLTMSEDNHGLRVNITPPDTPTGREVRELIRAGYVDKMSFGFEVVQERWTERDGKPPLREIQEVKLYEVSPVPIPAYDGTAVSARGYRPEQPKPEPARTGHSTCFGLLKALINLKGKE